MSLDELEWMLDDWRESADPFGFDEIAELLHDTIHPLLLAIVGDDIMPLSRVTDLFAPTLHLRRADVAEVLREYLCGYVTSVTVSPSGLVASDARIVDNVRFRHVLTAAEASTERLEETLDLAVVFDRLPPEGAAGECHQVTYRSAVDGDESDELAAIRVLEGPVGWLLGANAGDTIAVRWADGAPVVELADRGDPSAAVAAFRGVIDLVGRSRPVDIHHLLRVAAIEAGGLGGDLGAPLSEILTQAGWTTRDDMAAPAGFDWEAYENDSRRRGLATIMANAGVAGAHMIQPIESLVGELFGDGTFFDENARTNRIADGDAARVAGLLGEPGVAGSVYTLALGPTPTAAALESVLELCDSLLQRVGIQRRIGPARLGLLAAERAGRTSALVEYAGLAQLRGVDDIPLCSIAGDLALDQGRLDDARWHYRRGGVDLPTELQWVLGGADVPADTGRNERCPCGSGQKYKRCHGHAGGRPLSDSDRAHLLMARLGRHELRRRQLRSFRWNKVAGLVVDGGWMTDDAPRVAPLLETLAWFEDGGLAEFLDERGFLLPDDDRRLAESWLGAPLAVARRTDDGIRLADGRLVEQDRSPGAFPLFGSWPAVGRLVPVGDRFVLIRAVQFPACDDAAFVLRSAGADPDAIAGAIGSLRAGSDRVASGRAGGV